MDIGVKIQFQSKCRKILHITVDTAKSGKLSPVCDGKNI